jgi:hypothetical protein
MTKLSDTPILTPATTTQSGNILFFQAVNNHEDDSHGTSGADIENENEMANDSHHSINTNLGRIY